jgi:murein DD-endopeptidase MepM/ murein hydrolase activator NlpD
MRRRVAIAILFAGLLVPGSSAAAPGWTWPVEGEVLTPYRNGADPYAGGQHRGIDIAAPVGAAVRAASAGTVTFSGTAGSSGLTVAVRTADGRFDTSYLHLSAISVAKGDRVEGGSRLGTVGTSGKRSTAAPHLHFGVREAGSRHGYRDPLTLLPPPPVPVREAPRGVPVPAPAPVRAAPRRERAPRRLPSPRRVPAARRVRVPAARRLPHPAPGRPPLAAPRPVSPLTAPRSARRRAPGRAPSPRLGPRPVATPAPAERRPVARGGPEPAAPSPGPDLGMAAACVGLLLAAACLGGRGGGEPARRMSLRALLRPLTGRQ